MRPIAASKSRRLGVCPGAGVFISCLLCDPLVPLTTMPTAGAFLSACHLTVRYPIWRGVFWKGIVTPTQPMIAPRHGAGTVMLDGKEIDAVAAMTRFMVPFNFTGQPALSINCGFSNGLPVGLQIVADHFEEGKI